MYICYSIYPLPSFSYLILCSNPLYLSGPLSIYCSIYLFFPLSQNCLFSSCFSLLLHVCLYMYLSKHLCISLSLSFGLSPSPCLPHPVSLTLSPSPCLPHPVSLTLSLCLSLDLCISASLSLWFPSFISISASLYLYVLTFLPLSPPSSFPCTLSIPFPSRPLDSPLSPPEADSHLTTLSTPNESMKKVQELKDYGSFPVAFIGENKFSIILQKQISVLHFFACFVLFFKCRGT